MAQLRRNHDAFVERDTELLVLGPEDADAFATYWEQHHLPFTGLPDPKHSVLRLYGQEINLFKFGRMPAQIIIDKKGVVQFVHYGHSMQDIPPNEELLQLIDEMRENESQ